MAAKTAATRGWAKFTAWAVVVALIALAAVLTFAAWRVSPGSPDWLSFVLVSGLYVCVLSLPLHFEVRQQSILVSAGEIPFILGMFFFSPFWFIAMRVGGGLVVYSYRLITSQAPALKTVFNAANQSVAGATAALVAASAGLGEPNEPRTWGVLLLAVFVAHMVSALWLAMIILITQGRKGLDVMVQGFGSSTVITGINACLGILILLVITATKWSLLPLAVVVVLIFAAYRAYSNMVRQRKSLTDLNDFTQSVAEAVQSNRLVDIMTHRLRDMLTAEAATVWVPKEKRFPELLLTAYMDIEGLLDTTPVPEPLRREVLSTGEPLLVTPKQGKPEHRELLAAERVKDAILVPLKSGKTTFGCLSVANRLGGDLVRFRRDDLTLLETLAAHAGVAVENSRLVDKLRFDAYHDSLTELPNRRRTMNVIEESISLIVPNEIVAVMLFDVDSMREINDSIGHAAGDKLIVEVGRRLRGAAPPGAHVGRIDGDEFALVMRLPDAAAASELAGQIREELQRPCTLGTLNVDIDAAVGIAIHPESGDKADTLLQRADVATQSAKNVTSGVQVYNVALESGSVRRLGLASDLRRAFDAGELDVHYQPKITLTDRRLVGVECLARWHHPTHGDVAPEDFIPVAEHTGLLSRLTEFVLREGLSRASEWSEQNSAIGIAVNLSPRTLTDADFPSLVARLLDEYHVDAGRLTLEITEDGMVSAGGKMPHTLQRLRDLGIRLAVDDFGKGYSSLSYLRNLPASEIKIDKSFVQGMATDEGDLAIVRAVVDLARHFHMTVVAEGVESEMTLSHLTEMGCDIAQGFYFSRPLAADRFVAWMAAQSADTTPPKLRAV
ncbi:diguanylate cyclase/phosphodiesterase with GAF sensor [Stackebrandtia nassauensis DSM 44728]|uniref:Diguanylate cyclase/phosphodiesterase with GAF sensor n=1 Tax=Stackebrandtia nassauensis (strain DSM 44728 / CIP 108903 / NRRL B-16338 / NBRC 102104 / LLR-40K-21) TaxID=446470 RepID=D3Q498_STANL|nr:diguanylate cyclase/phosphodiesterase with GAF sensor [Stackebrandtia nassauensis DSM 44728]